MTQIKEKLIQELKRKECQNALKSYTVLMILGLPLFQLWMSYGFFYPDEIAKKNIEYLDQIEPVERIVILLGLLTVQWLPLYLIWRFTWGVGGYIIWKCGWYQDFHDYGDRKTKSENGHSC